jgi:hypothetical protein
MRFLMLVAVICLVIALLGAASVLHGVNVTAWAIGGLLAWAVDVALAPYPLGWPARRTPPA